MQGNIKRIRPDRGFGFIRPDGDRGQGDHFFHRSQLLNLPFDETIVGRRVEFESALGEKGLRATSIREAINGR